MPEWLKAIIFGIVEGISEWLPISSTGHMILLDEFLKLEVSPEFWEMFLVVIQLGAILAVILLYFERLNPFGRQRGRLYLKKDIVTLWKKIVVSCIPAGVVGIVLDEKIEELFYHWQTVAVMLILVGIWFLRVERKASFRGGSFSGMAGSACPVKKDLSSAGRVESLKQLTYKDALVIGLFQLVAAVFPGTSRSGATILGALMLGVSRTVAAEYTFFLAVPVMLGASGLKLLKFGFHYSAGEASVLLFGMISAFAVSVAAIRFLTGYIKKHDFKVFGWYRIVLGGLVILYFAL